MENAKLVRIELRITQTSNDRTHKSSAKSVKSCKSFKLSSRVASVRFEVRSDAETTRDDQMQRRLNATDDWMRETIRDDCKRRSDAETIARDWLIDARDDWLVEERSFCCDHFWSRRFQLILVSIMIWNDLELHQLILSSCNPADTINSCWFSYYFDVLAPFERPQWAGESNYISGLPPNQQTNEEESALFHHFDWKICTVGKQNGLLASLRIHTIDLVLFKSLPHCSTPFDSIGPTLLVRFSSTLIDSLRSTLLDSEPRTSFWRLFPSKLETLLNVPERFRMLPNARSANDEWVARWWSR